MRLRIRAALFCALALPLGAACGAPAFPDKPIKVIVPFPPGGPVDTLARLLSQKVDKLLGQPLIVENRPGAGGSIGAANVARSAPDGYTLLLTASSYAMDPAVRPGALSFDPRKDMQGVSLVAAGPVVLLTTNAFPGKTVPSLIDVLKQHPGKYSYASTGVGTVNQFAGELFKEATHTNVLHVPYNGAAPATQAILAGEVDIFFNNVLSSLAQIKSGKVRALAVTSAQRWPSLPDVPTLAESGLPGFEISSWYGLLAPAGTPRPVLEKLSAAIGQIVNDPETREKIVQLGLEPQAMSPDRFQSYIGEEIDKWTAVAHTAGIKAE